MLRPGFEPAIPQIGIGLAARRTASGLELEMRLPWTNFPQFKAVAGQFIGLDSELSIVMAMAGVIARLYSAILCRSNIRPIWVELNLLTELHEAIGKHAGR